MKNLPLLYRTLKDIPAKQLFDRLSYELKIRTISKLREKTREKILLGKITTPQIRKSYLEKLYISDIETGKYSGKLSFEFLKDKREFETIIWNSVDYPRLWQFHLHYFDYLTKDLNLVYKNELEKELFVNKTSYLINDWIDNNPFYSLDGWHPYTTSLRLVNWVYSFKAFPALANDKNLTSAWKQLLYLSKNKETFAGGNHLLENLRSLIIAGLYFDNEKSKEIVFLAIKELEKELNKQILADGGHYELSSSYHLLMTKLLTEVIIAINSANWDLPEIFKQKLKDMLEFSKAIRLKDGSYPLWNDGGFDSAPALDEVLCFASMALNQPLADNIDCNMNPLFVKLLENVSQKGVSRIKNVDQVGLTKLEKSGYYFLRSNDLELSFDAALPGPKDLPGHAHADCLSFNLYKNGEPIIVETGTSQYGSGKIRSYERSTAAHNTIVINKQDQSEVWGGFRVGAKAKPVNVTSGKSKDIPWLSACHNGYEKLGALHCRWIGMIDDSIVLIDRISGNSNLDFSSYIHFAPKVEISKTNGQFQLSPSGLSLNILSNKQSTKISLETKENSDSYYAPQMGQKIPRAKLTISGSKANADEDFIICMVFHFKQKISEFRVEKRHLSLQISDKHLKWVLDKGEIKLTEDCRE